MYSAIVVDCQTGTDKPYCEDCMVKKICKARFNNQTEQTEASLKTFLALEIPA